MQPTKLITAQSGDWRGEVMRFPAQAHRSTRLAADAKR